NRRHQLDYRDLCAEPPPYGAELESDHAATNHDQMLGNFGNLQRTGVRQHKLLVEFQERQFDWNSANCDDDALRAVVFRLSIRPRDVHNVALLQRAATPGPGHLVLAEQV